MPKFRIKWSSERLLGLSAMSISFITLLIFIYQTNLMRKQNSLSILPYLMVSTTNNSGENTFELNIKNHGVGPAIIESATILYKGERYDLSNYEDNIYNFLVSITPALDSLKIYSFASLNQGLAIPAGTSYNLMQVLRSPDDYELLTTRFQRLMDEGLDYEIIYKSIQNERWLISDQANEPKAL